MRRYARIVLGFLALIAGIILALPLVPGPGLALIGVGLVLLSDHFPWARRALDWMKRKWQSVRAR